MSGEPERPAVTVPFRVCGSCEKQWASSYDFVVDPEIRLLGLQMVPNSPKGNLLVFGHRCGTSISVFTQRLGDLLADPDDDDADPDPEVSYEECKRHCEKIEDLAACDRLCPKAGDRQLVQAILKLKRGSD